MDAEGSFQLTSKVTLISSQINTLSLMRVYGPIAEVILTLSKENGKVVWNDGCY